MTTSHEDYSRSTHGRGGSDRSFGFVFGGFFAAIAILPVLSGHPVRLWAIPASIGFLVLAVVRPAVFRRLNRIWTRLGLLLGKVMNPVMMAVVYFLVFTPIAIILRLFKRDALGIAYEPEAKSYWILRDSAGSEAENLRNQF
jgi:hypothetical protein